jgi:hypothetical protein
MSNKPKFKPAVTRVKLNPEQAVLSCDCYDGSYTGPGNVGGGWYVCSMYAPKVNGVDVCDWWNHNTGVS